MGKINHLRISKAEWYRLGGFARTGLFRRMRGGSWQYFIDTTLIKNSRGESCTGEDF